MNQLIVNNLFKYFRLDKRERNKRKTNKTIIKAVDDISFKLDSGEIYGLLGPNGAGKTTTLRLISSLIKPDKGEIIYNGKNIYDDVYAYRGKVGFLTSELKLDDFFTPDYLFTYMARLYGLKDDEIASKKEYLFKRFGVDAFRNVKIGDLSTGMKQKASLAISLCHNPELIIFDEPTNGLDIVASRDVETFLASLKEEGKIILISTHIFSLIEKLADRVGILVDGKLIKEDSLASLTKEKSLEEVFFDLYKGN